MAYKEVSRVEITEVVRQWQAGRGIREITRSTGISRNTIRKYILAAHSCGLGRDVAAHRSAVNCADSNQPGGTARHHNPH